MDPDPRDAKIQDANKKLIFSTYFFLKVLLHNFSKIKSRKEVKSQNRRNHRFCLQCLLHDRRIRIRYLVTNGSGYRYKISMNSPSEIRRFIFFYSFKKEEADLQICQIRAWLFL